MIRLLLTTALLLAMHFIAEGQIINIEERRIESTNDSTQWYGSLNLGASLSKVKDQVAQVNSGAHVQLLSGENLLLLLLDFRFLRAGSQNFSNSGYAHLRYNRELSERWAWETFGQLQYNRLLLIRQRSLAGAGFRWQAFRSESGENRLNIGLSYLYEFNEFTEGNAATRWHRLNSYISFAFRLGDNGAKFLGTTYFQPRWDKWSNHRLSSEWRLSFPVLEKLSFSTFFVYSADTALPTDAPTSTYSWNNGIVWKL